MTDLWEDHSLFPMFWIEEFADLNDDYKETLDKMLIKPLKIIDGVQWTMVSMKIIQRNIQILLFVEIKIHINFKNVHSVKFHFLVCCWCCNGHCGSCNVCNKIVQGLAKICIMKIKQNKFKYIM